MHTINERIADYRRLPTDFLVEERLRARDELQRHRYPVEEEDHDPAKSEDAHRRVCALDAVIRERGPNTSAKQA